MDDGGPAFPQSLVDNQGRIDTSIDYGKGGMSLRDHFAGQVKIDDDYPLTNADCAKFLGIKEFPAAKDYDLWIKAFAELEAKIRYLTSSPE